MATNVAGEHARDVTLDEVRTDCTVILIPDFDDPAEAEAFIAAMAEYIERNRIPDETIDPLVRDV